jgi:hypothetical protein
MHGLSLDIALEIMNISKDSDIEDPVRTISRLCEIEREDDLRRELFEKDGLCQLLSCYDPKCHGDFNGKIYKFVRGLSDTLYRGNTALFVCMLYLELRYEFNEALKRLPDELVNEFIEGLKEFARSGDPEDSSLKNSDKICRSAAKRFYTIREAEGVPSLAIEYIDKCINKLADVINNYLPIVDRFDGKKIKHNSIKLYGYISMMEACRDKIKKEEKDEN